MSDESLKSEILSQYRSKGGCKDIYKELYAADGIDGLVEVYLKHPDWCLELGFPSLNSLRKDFSNLDDKNIFLDCHFNGRAISSQVAVFHNCSGTIYVEMDQDNAVIPMLYFANGCEMHVECLQTNAPAIYVPLYIYGDNFITTNGHGNARFRRYEHDIA